MISKVMRGRATKAIVAAALLGAVLAVGTSSPIGAQPQVKSLPASCKGADAKTDGYLGALGGSPSLPIVVTSDVPATLEPEQNGSPISFSIAVNLSQDLVDRATGLGVSSMNISNVAVDVTAGGPGIKEPIVIEGRPGPSTLTLTAGQPAGVTVGPFAGTLDGVKKGGLIKYTLTKLNFTISTTVAAVGAVDLNLICSAPGTAAITNIPIPGAPVIQQPIAVNAVAGQKVLVDVLGQYTTKGTTEDGRQLDIDPSSLKVLEGPGVVEGGQVAITTGESTSVLVEVCATEQLPGTNEVQRLVLDPTPEALKKGVAFTLKSGDKVTPPIDLVGPSLLGPSAFDPSDADPADPQRWKNNANKYIFSTHQLPSPAEIDLALESILGPGTVEVSNTDLSDPAKAGTKLPGGTYDIKFTAQADAADLSLGNWWSVFPQEVLQELLALAGSIGGDGEGEEEPSPVPEGMTTKQYFDQLLDETRAALETLNFDLAGQKFGQAMSLVGDLLVDAILENIDAILEFINGLFTKVPSLETTVAGEEPFPICSQAVIDVTVAAVGGTSTPTDVSGISQTNSGARLALAG